jgi:hypothetical protein
VPLTLPPSLLLDSSKMRKAATASAKASTNTTITAVDLVTTAV